MRRSIRTPEQLEAPGRDEDGDVSESLRTCIWQPLGLLTTVKPPALRERHDLGAVEVQFLSPRCRGDAHTPWPRLTLKTVKRV